MTFFPVTIQAPNAWGCLIQAVEKQAIAVIPKRLDFVDLVERKNLGAIFFRHRYVVQVQSILRVKNTPQHAISGVVASGLGDSAM